MDVNELQIGKFYYDRIRDQVFKILSRDEDSVNIVCIFLNIDNPITIENTSLHSKLFKFTNFKELAIITKTKRRTVFSRLFK